MIVYRVQDEAGYGPYRGDHRSWFPPEDDVLEQPNFHNRRTGERPDYYAETEAVRALITTAAAPDGYRFGFATVDSYLRWFRRQDWRDGLRAAGFRLARWEVDPRDAAVGRAQVVFRPQRAVVVATCALPDHVELTTEWTLADYPTLGASTAA